jgi:hypothetical protein
VIRYAALSQHCACWDNAAYLTAPSWQQTYQKAPIHYKLRHRRAGSTIRAYLSIVGRSSSPVVSQGRLGDKAVGLRTVRCRPEACRRWIDNAQRAAFHGKQGLWKASVNLLQSAVESLGQGSFNGQQCFSRNCFRAHPVGRGEATTANDHLETSASRTSTAEKEIFQ